MEENNTNLKKRKKSNQLGCIIVLAVLGLLMFLVYNRNNSEKEKDKIISEAHCKIEWSKLDNQQKEKVLNEFLKNEHALSTKLTPSMLASELIKESAKYPGTVTEDNLAFGKITNIDKGLIEYQNNFTAQNKLGMKVNGHYWLTIKYNAGCKDYEVIDFKVD